MSRRSADLPLFAWARTPRENRAKSRKWMRRAIWIAALAAGLTYTIAAPPRPVLVWNASASAPIGLYRVGAKTGVKRGDMVIAWVPESHRMFAAKRHYLPRNVPLVKRIAAVPGDRVCAFGSAVFVNSERVAHRLPKDRKGRELPWWRGCRTLGGGSHLLLMDHPGSFDGRYFGPTSRKGLVGKATLLWER